MSLKYRQSKQSKINVNWHEIETGRSYQPVPSSAAGALADMFITASTTLAEEVTQDFANDNTRLKLVLAIKPPPPKLEYYSNFTITSNDGFDEDKKLQLNQQLLRAVMSAQEKLALELGLNMELTPGNQGNNNLKFRNISPTKRARFDVELNKLIPGIFKEVCQTLGYSISMTPTPIPQNTLSPYNKMTPFHMTPRPYR